MLIAVLLFFFFQTEERTLVITARRYFIDRKFLSIVDKNRGRDSVDGFSGPMYPDHPLSFNLYLSDVYERKTQRQMASQAIRI